MSTRRGLLLASAAGGAGLLAACGASPGTAGGTGTARSASDRADARAINAVLALEEQALALYTGGLRRLRGSTRELGRTLIDAEQAHVDQLAKAVVRLGGVSRAPRDHYELPQLLGERDALRSFAALERRLIAAYLDALPQVRDAAARTTMGAILAAEAEHATVLDGRLGRRQAARALVGSDKAA